MTGPGTRAGRHLMPTANAVPFVAPHAALLIDFDNVTMGVRSDLTKELKALLNSDIIKGKVTVQRAYADWRRYPQYVMPLTERSIDMIWATAVGSTKKNATDIRLAIDAIELVFTRPEIGTFIILSGDSDFSSLVLKLKEYGKYVIGIGIRESASDLLIQNCDEYYSYSELAGLNKEVDGPSVQRDPWELVRDGVARMVQQGDVMRSDRLKQVMQQLDPNFDERNAGFNRFSKFVAEAANRGLLVLSKLDNGQFEVAPSGGAAPRAAATASTPTEPSRGRGRDNGRGRGGRSGGRGPRDREPHRDPASAAAPAASPERLTLAGAFDLLRKALGELPSPARHDAVRARMAALHGREDALLDASQFVRLLRQANDAEIAEVKKTGDDEYELVLSRVERAKITPNGGNGHGAGLPSPEAPAAESPAGESGPTRSATLRFRRGSRVPSLPLAVPMVGMVQVDTPKAPPANAVQKEPPPAKSPKGRIRAKKAATPAAAAEAAAQEAPGVSAPKPGSKGRRRSRGRRRAEPESSVS